MNTPLNLVRQTAVLRPSQCAIATIALMMALAPCAFPWGDVGHRTIAQVAHQRLTPAAQQKVDAILRAEDIGDAAVWPDKIRAGKHPGPLAHTPEGEAFNSAHPNNSLWHFVDLPLSTTTYKPSTAFTDDDDVVQAIGRCIEVLEGRSQTMTNIHALRWLIHLVGDIHQPLHVACGYYRFDDQDDPHLVRGATTILRHHIEGNSDHGANKLHYTQSEKLHAYWDSVLVSHIDDQGAPLATVLQNRIAAANYHNAGSSYRSWPAKWAIASVGVSRGIYDRLTLLNKDADQDGWYIMIAHPSTYQATEVPIAADQLARAAFNLAELLNRIQWQ